MLNKQEKTVMSLIFKKCIASNGSILLSVNDISSALYPKFNLSEIEINETINNLALEDYITNVNSDKKGTPVFCISLKPKGESFEREKESHKKTIRMLIIRTILLACLSFIIGLILKAIFS